jgi:outer membrane receptor protein involved in Fe transport
VEAGQLERFGTLDPTDGGGSQRHAARLALVRRGAGGGELRLMAYAVRYQLNLFSNFTFFAADPVNGDQILQTDARTLAGLEGRYTRGLSLGSVELLTSGGIRVRSDGIDNTLAHTVRREVLAPRVDARVDEASLGAWTELDATWTPWLRTVLGLRADLFNAAVRDRLEDTAVLGNATSGTAQALRMSPKASVVLSPADSLDVFLNFGQGFHSNDARGWVRAQAPVTPLTGATGYEVGVRARPLPGLDVAASVWALDLQSETVWVGDEGTTEERGPTHRRGVEVEARYRVTPWLRADADVTLTRARFVEDTGAGTRVPLAPRLTASAGLTAEHPSGVFGSLRAGGMGDRPANEDGSLTARGFWLVNAEAGYQSQRFRVALEARNLLDATWEEAQFANESRLPDEDAPIEDVHFTPGAPRALRLSASFFF